MLQFIKIYSAIIHTIRLREQSSMTSEEVFNDLKIILSEEFEVEEELITLGASFYDEMGLDSLDAIDLVVNISDKYNIDIGNKAIEETKTIQQLIDAVLDKLNN